MLVSPRRGAERGGAPHTPAGAYPGGPYPGLIASMTDPRNGRPRTSPNPTCAPAGAGFVSRSIGANTATTRIHLAISLFSPDCSTGISQKGCARWMSRPSFLPSGARLVHGKPRTAHRAPDDAARPSRPSGGSWRHASAYWESGPCPFIAAPNLAGATPLFLTATLGDCSSPRLPQPLELSWKSAIRQTRSGLRR